MQHALATISSPSLAQQIAIAAIQKMFSGSFFCICDVRNACKVMEKDLDEQTENYLQALHCMKWGVMTPDIQKFIFDVCNAVCK